eukprot:Skav234730  [mRNA]  locus=scaffold634:769143:776207:- [translate_table: standard]
MKMFREDAFCSHKQRLSAENAVNTPINVMDHEPREEMLTEAVYKLQEEAAAAEAAAAETAQPSNPVPQPRGKTFCNATLGICDIGIQRAAKLARCRQCCQPIQRGSARVGWSFSRVKFHAWVHCDCFPLLLRAEGGDVGQAVEFVTNWLEQNSSSEAIGEITRLSQVLHNVQEGFLPSASGASSSRG